MRLLGIGGAHIDRRGQVSGDYAPAASNPGTMREDIGGGALNALRNAAQLGLDCALISIRGGDGAGEQVARTVSEAGIRDLSVTFLDRTTPSYTALIDRHGELIAGFADMGLYDLAFPKQMRRAAVRDAVGVADAVLVDANVPAAGLEKLAALATGKPVFAIGVSPAKVVRLAGILGELECAFLNRREAEALVKVVDPHSVSLREPPLPRSTGARKGATSGADAARTSADIHEGASSPPSNGGEVDRRSRAGVGVDLILTLRAAGLRSAVITAGAEAIIGYDGDGAFALTPPAPRHVTDVTGAGDALAGATIAAMLTGKPLREALREGVAASILAIESQSAVPVLSKEALAEVLVLVPEPQPVA